MKILFLEIADRIEQQLWFPFYQAVYGVQAQNEYTGIIASDFEPEEIGFNSLQRIISLEVNKSQYLNVTSLAEVIQNDSSFWVDPATSILYVHFEGGLTPYSFEQIFVGVAIGFYNTVANDFDGLIDGIPYEPRLLDGWNFKSSKDDLFFGKQVYQTSSFTFSDQDRKYKNFSTPGNNRTGSLVRALYYIGDTSPSYTDLVLMYQGQLETVEEGLTVRLNARDIRQSLDLKSPTRLLDNSGYPFLKDSDKDYIIPEIWGSVTQAPCLCLNENVNKDKVSGFVDYEFLYCDSSNRTVASQPITQIFVDNEAVTVSPLPTIAENAMQNIYTFTIPHEIFQVIDDSANIKYQNMSKVSVNCTGYLDGTSTLIENPLHIIREKLLDVYDYTYTSVYYDLTTWALFETYYSTRNYKCGYYFNKPIEMSKVIEDIQVDTIGTFVWGADLKFSWRIDDFSFPDLFITLDGRVGPDYLTINVDSTEVLSTFRVGYKKNYSERGELEYTYDENTDNQSEALLTYNSTFSKDFETRLTNVNGVTNYQERVLNIGSFSNDTLEVTVPPIKPIDQYSTINPIDIVAGQFISLVVDDQDTEILGQYACQVIERGAPLSGSLDVPLTVRLWQPINDVQMIFHEDGVESDWNFYEDGVYSSFSWLE